MRFRPSSINYLADALSNYATNTKLLSVIIERVQEGERETHKVQDSDGEQLELRSSASDNADDFHTIDDNNFEVIETVVDSGNVALINRDDEMILANSPETTVLATFITGDSMRVSASPIALRLHWYIYLSQLRKSLTNSTSLGDLVDFKSQTSRPIPPTDNCKIPSQLLQAIQAFALIVASNQTSDRISEKIYCGKHKVQNNVEGTLGISNLLDINIKGPEHLKQGGLSQTCNISRPYVQYCPPKSEAPLGHKFESIERCHRSFRPASRASVDRSSRSCSSRQVLQANKSLVDDEIESDDHDWTIQHLASPSKTTEQTIAVCFDDLDQHDDKYGNVLLRHTEILDQELEANLDSTHEKKKKEKKPKRKKKKKRYKKCAEKEAYSNAAVGVGRYILSQSQEASKITPENLRRHSSNRIADQDVNFNGCIEPMVKPRHPYQYRRDVLTHLNESTAEIQHEYQLNCPKMKSHKITPSRNATERLETPDGSRPPDQSVSDLHRSTGPNEKDIDALETPRASPEPSVKRSRDECLIEISSTSNENAKRCRMRDNEPEEFHVLCSEALIESWPRQLTSLAAGTWIDHAELEHNDQDSKCMETRIIAHDSSLLDEIGIDMEVSGKEAILVQRLSSWGREEDLKAFVRDLVKLSALGRYIRVHVVICIDMKMTRASAKVITSVQSSPLGSVDCVVSFQLVVPGSMAAALAITILRGRIQSSREVDMHLYTSIGDCQAQASFLLRIVASLTVLDTLRLLQGNDGKSPRSLWKIFGITQRNSQFNAQLSMAAQAPLNGLQS